MPAVILQNQPRVSRSATLLEGLAQGLQGFQAGQQRQKQFQQREKLINSQVAGQDIENQLNKDRLDGRSVDNIIAGLEGIGFSPEQAGGFANIARSSDKINFNDLVQTPQRFNATAGATEALKGGDTSLAAGLNSIGNAQQIQPQFDTNAQGITTNKFDGDTRTSGLTDSIVGNNNAQAFERRQGGLLDQQTAENAQNGIGSSLDQLKQQKAQLEVNALQKKADAGDLAKQNTFDTFSSSLTNVADSLADTSTGPVAGLLPAVTAAQQTAEGAIAATAPVLKQIFRQAGEGTFTDKDQELLVSMIPTRSDHAEAAINKLNNIVDLVGTKLNATPEQIEGLRSQLLAEYGSEAQGQPGNEVTDQDQQLFSKYGLL